MLVSLPGSSAAESVQTDLLKRFGVRVDGGVAFFLSRDQLDWLGFKRPGFLAELSFSMLVKPWLSAELGGTIGIFMPGGKASVNLSAATYPRASHRCLRAVRLRSRCRRSWACERARTARASRRS